MSFLRSCRPLYPITFITSVRIHLLAKLESFIHCFARKDGFGIGRIVLRRWDLDHDELFLGRFAMLALGVGGGAARDVLQGGSVPRKAIVAKSCDV